MSKGINHLRKPRARTVGLTFNFDSNKNFPHFEDKLKANLHYQLINIIPLLKGFFHLSNAERSQTAVT